jgi:hypothetical protein
VERQEETQKECHFHEQKQARKNTPLKNARDAHGSRLSSFSNVVVFVFR